MRRSIDLSCYLVLDTRLCPTPEKMVQTAMAAVRGGATVVQLRAPEWKKRKQLQTALLLKQALAPAGVPLIIDDHIDVALIAKADGVHVGQDDLPASEARKILGEDARGGLSVGSMEELKTLTPDSDYIGVGPIFPTLTKADAGAAIGLEGLAEIRKATDIPIVGIGGINVENAASVIKAGANGVAVVSAICGADDPQEAARKFRTVTNL